MEEIFIKAMENDLAYIMKNVNYLMIKDKSSKTLLHYAVLGSANDVIDYLLEQEIDVNATDKYGETAIFDCARKAKLQIAKKLIKRQAKLDLKNHQHETLFHLAAHKGNLDFLQLLLENKSPINQKNIDGKLPIHYAILAGHANLIEFLMEIANLNWFETDQDLNTFLHYAAKTTNPELIKLFLEHLVDPNSLNNQFETPLFFSAKSGSIETNLLLIKAGSFIEITNRRFETAIEVAKFNENFEILELLKEWQDTLSYQTYKEKYQLTLAVLNRDQFLLRELVLKGVKPYINQLKFTPIDYAHKYKLVACINILRSVSIKEG